MKTAVKFINVNRFQKISLVICFLLFLFAVPGCKKNDTPSSTTLAPTISGFSPATSGVGQTIVITGSNFSSNPANDLVEIGGVQAEVIAATTTSLTVVIPSGISGGSISVTVNGQTGVAHNTITLTSPSVSGFLPSLVGIGYPVIVTGKGFGTDMSKIKVSFNGTAGGVLVSASDTALVVTVPIGATSGGITVVVNGQSATSANNLQIRSLTVSTLAGSIPGFSDGTGSAAKFHGAWGIVGDGLGNYFVADAFNSRIRKVSSTGIVTTFTGTSSFGNKNGSLDTATFGSPFGIAMDSHGNIFVTDFGFNNIREISASGFVSTFAGDTYGATGTADGFGTNARFHSPLGITIDQNDNIFVIDGANNTVRKITSDGHVTTLAGSGVAASIDGTGTAASFNGPCGIGVDATGNIYVVETGASKIRKVTQTGVVTTFAGSGIPGTKDGPVDSARFNQPICIVSDHQGNFYVTDQGNGTIRMISSDGTVSTLAGSGNQVSTDGVGAFASLAYPLGIAIDATGALYVVDNGTDQIRKILVQ